MPDNPKTPTEPSMEEIIASIYRTTTEDKRSIEPVSSASAENPDILDLTQIVDQGGSVRRMAPLAEKTAASTAISAPAASSPVAHGTMHGEAATTPRIDAGRERILSSVTSGAAAAAFAQLGALPRDGRRESESPRGDFAETAAIAQSLKRVFRSARNWPELDDRQREALEMIATKLARLLTGDPNYADHAVDIAAYAELFARAIVDDRDERRASE
jgi:hypothetical protein